MITPFLAVEMVLAVEIGALSLVLHFTTVILLTEQ